MHEATHASFFSGAGGLDLGLERAGWRTVSFSEIDPYASAVLAQRWPGVPNLGDITAVTDGRGGGQSAVGSGVVAARPESRAATAIDRHGSHSGGPDWHRATLWSGGFPCQDLSVAGKRRGLAGSRSGLAFSFLDLVGRHRPRFVLLENVPGLLSSHGGKDFGTLLAALVELGYGVGYRVLDARYFGVPQRRRRVFILGDSLGGRAGAERAAEVLSVGSRCRRHPPTGIEAGPGAAAGTRPGVDIARAVTGTSGKRHDDDTDTLLSPASYAHRNGATDGLARRSHDRDGVADTLTVGGRDRGAGDSYDNTPWVVNALDQRRGGAHDIETQAGHLVTAYTKSHNVDGYGNPETWVSGREARSMNGFDGDRTTLVLGGSTPDDPLLPLGLDSHRYRCAGNGVVADVGEWIGQRLLGSIA